MDGIKGAGTSAHAGQAQGAKLGEYDDGRESLPFRHLCAPALRSLELKERLQMDPVATLLQPPSPLLLESIRRALPRNEIFSIVVGSQINALQISGEGGHAGISLSCSDPDGLSRWLAEEFVSELSYVSEMRLRLSSSRPSSELQGLRKLMEGLNNVVQLVSPNVNTGAAALLVEHLGSPYQTSDGWRWRWPDLRHVELDDAWKWSDLTFTMIQERYGSSQAEHGNPSGGAPNWYPAPLKTLRLRGMKFGHPDTFRSIERIVGKDVLEL